jgi:hypothetical protein
MSPAAFFREIIRTEGYNPGPEQPIHGKDSTDSSYDERNDERPGPALAPELRAHLWLEKEIESAAELKQRKLRGAKVLRM